MRNIDVPLEKYSIEFSPQKLENPDQCHKTMVSILRFLEDKIIPEITKFEASLNTSKHDISENPTRNTADTGLLTYTSETINDFIEKVIARLGNYLNLCLKSVHETNDKILMSEWVNNKVDNEVRSLRIIALKAEQRLDQVADGNIASSKENSEEGNDYREKVVQEAIEHARTRYATPLYRLIR